MNSRTKKIMKLLDDNAEKENVASNHQFDAECVPSIVCRPVVARRCSTSSSSSSSRSSSTTSIYEDSDDSVRDPDYQKQTDPDTDNDDVTVPEKIPPTMKKKTSPSITSSINYQSNAEVSHTLHSTTPPRTMVEDLPSTSHHYTTPTRRGRKRQKNEQNWKCKVAKRMRNLGKPYESSKTRKTILERRVKEPCKETCKFKCILNITEDQRIQIHKDYWSLGSIEKQWTFIANSAESVIPKFRYIKVDFDGNYSSRPPRNSNQAFYFTVSNNKVRVCKLFFANTLGINFRPIDTALQKKNKLTNVSLMQDNRGLHGKQPKVDENIKFSIKKFIEAIPKIESHYTRANTTKYYIDGSKSMADLHRDYVDQCKENNTVFGNYLMFYRIFTQDYNISFFSPKKDLCEMCEIYKNSSDEEKESLKQVYENHIREKELSRDEKAKDKANKNIVLSVYDLQAVHQCPKGDVSVFYYKSKLNVLNLTVYDLHTNKVSCYVWDESNAHRGVNEIGTCVYKYLQEVNSTGQNLDVVFYSDNCAGQQKNKFMIAMYLFAVQSLANIKTITHKYLIKGHTQNEGDSAHSQIERQVKRQLKSGPMYTPDAFIGAIKAARKKSEPFRVHEMCYDDIYDWKKVCTQMGMLLQKDEENNSVKIGDIKIFKVLKDEPRCIYFKTSYSHEVFKKAIVIKRRKEIEVEVSKAYDAKVGITERKKADLMELVHKNVIPRYYKAFFESL